jgi:uncharacterized repeat protein (TIGR01451 family)
MMSIPRAARGSLLLLCLLALLALVGPATSGAVGGFPVQTCTGKPATVPGGFAAPGQWVVLENNVGAPAPHGGTADFADLPMCAVRTTGSGTTGAPQWIFCTQVGLYGCGQNALGAAGLAAGLDARAEAEIAWAVASSDLSDAVGRAVAQTRVWCVSDRVLRHRSDADIVAEARRQYAKSGIALPAGTACPDWRTVDAGLRTSPQLTVRAVAAQVPAGGVARYEITTNLPRVRVTPGFALCPDVPAGVTLNGDMLAVSGTSDAVARTVPLCAAAPVQGVTQQLAASAPDVLAGELTVIRSVLNPELCQLMVTATGDRLSATATVTGAPVPVPVSVPVPSTAQVAQSAPAAHLTIAKRRVRRTGEPRRVRSGAAVRWAITVRNTGTATAQAVRACDVLRRGLAVVGTRPRARPSGGRICWTLRSVQPGQRITLRITTRVSVGADVHRRCHVLANQALIVGGPSATSKVTVCRRQRAPRGGTTG